MMFVLFTVLGASMALGTLILMHFVRNQDAVLITGLVIFMFSGLVFGLFTSGLATFAMLFGGMMIGGPLMVIALLYEVWTGRNCPLVPK